MIVPDVNLLLYAHITAFSQHAAARRWWERALSGEVEVGLAAAAVFGFVRIASSRRVFTEPMAVDNALAHVERWLARPNARLLLPGPDHLAIAFRLLRDAGTAGNLTTDAQLAAHAIEHQALLCSNDTDFGRFSGLRWTNPLV